jgi:hypothetical protein
MGAVVNEKQVGGLLARPSPLTQDLQNTLSSAHQKGKQVMAAVAPQQNGGCSGRRGLSGLLADCGIPGAFIIDATEGR